MEKAKKTTPEKKLLCFTNPFVMNKVIKDMASTEKTTESAVVENIILDAILPKNKLLADIVMTYLYVENGGIGLTLNALFKLNSNGSNWTAIQTNYRPLVDYAFRNEKIRSSSVNATSNTLPQFIHHLKALIEKFEELSIKDLELKEKYENDATYVKCLLKELEEDSQFSNLCNFYTAIIKNWNVLENWTTTFSLLADLSLLEENWLENGENRIELLKIVKEMSESWIE